MKCETNNKHGALKHWIALRVTAVIAIPLCIWLVFSIVSLAGADHGTFVQWLADPLNAFEMALFVVVVFYHAALGCQEIVEDYIQNECLKKLKICGINLFFILAAAVCLAAIAKIMLGNGV